MKRVFSVFLLSAFVVATLATEASGAIVIDEGFDYGLDSTSWTWNGDYLGPDTSTGLNGGAGFAAAECVNDFETTF